MSIPYFFEPFTESNFIQLSDETYHHALQVLRMKSGEQFWICNGKGSKVLCTIEAIQKKSFQFSHGEMIVESMQHPQLHLAIAFTKTAARIEWLLEKVTEMGIHSIMPLLTKRTERNHFKRERLEKILVSAMLQSQQSYLPILHEACQLEDVIKLPIQHKFIAHCEENKKGSSFHESLPKGENVLVLIGPEGDFTHEEIDLCINATCKPVIFGVTRLRTETAGLYACAVFNAKQV